MNFSDIGALISLELSEINAGPSIFPSELLDSAARVMSSQKCNWLPLLVAETETGYELCHGSFIFEAAKKAMLEEVSCIIVPEDAAWITGQEVNDFAFALKKSTVKELRKLAQEKNIKGRSKMRKEELIKNLLQQ